MDLSSRSRQTNIQKKHGEFYDHMESASEMNVVHIDLISFVQDKTFRNLWLKISQRVTGGKTRSRFRLDLGSRSRL